MPTIPLRDQLGLDLDAQLAPGSALLKYFQQVPSLRFDDLDFSKVGGMTLDQPAVQMLKTGLSFNNPVDLGDGAPTLSIAAGAHGTLRFVTNNEDLPGQDDDVNTPQDTGYVSFTIDATASANLSAAAGGITFGASPSTSLQLASYSRFPLKAGVTVLQAAQQTICNFTLPVNSGDLAGMPSGHISRVSVSGALKLSGDANLLATANPLATVSLPAPLPQVAVSAGGSISIGVSCEIDADYELAARKLDSGAVRLAWHHRTGVETAVHLSANEGISTKFNGADPFSTVVSAISPNPKADLAELAQAGVPDDQASAIQTAVKAAAMRKLEIAISSEISATASNAATFLFEITPAALNDQSRQAVDQALKGDLTGLHLPGLQGVVCLRSVWEKAREGGVELDVNLLGILNCRSIASLSLEGKVLYESATGSLVITDRATAERIQSTQLNYGADVDKLRHVLAESFLVTAVYHGARQVAVAPALHCSHSFFELQHNTSRADMVRKLRAGVAVGLLSGAEAVPPEGITDFGRTLFSLSTDYDADLMTGMFLDNSGKPLPREQYEAAGREAIQFLVKQGDIDAVRLKPSMDDGLWSRMKDLGQPGIPSLFPGVPAPLVGAILADYTTIQWWTAAMYATAQKLSAFRLWLAQNPAAKPEDAAFQKLRDDLADHLRQVAANTRDEFGQPWGLIAMHQLAVRKSGAKMMISSPKLVVNRGTSLAATTGS